MRKGVVGPGVEVRGMGVVKGGGEGGYPVRVREIKLPINLRSFGDSHASERLRSGGN
jgi:hypothetical protein